jgi:peptidoglycan/LPS O-acetylase OafA/YrhL
MTAVTEHVSGPSSTGRTFRPEIQGLRAVAAFLVAIYHIWFDRVSGGVDIFFVVSGFLITESLVKSLLAGRFDLRAYLSRLARRLFPSAYIVLLATAVGVIVTRSQVYWVETFRELAAAALYLANVELGRNAVDYLAQDGPQSPVMHFWALSIQGQFYVLWPALTAVLLLASRRFAPHRHPARTVLAGLLTTLAVSLGYSMYLTATNQPLAYFSMPARMWEFALGGVVALSLQRLTLPHRVAAPLSFVALVTIVSFGAVVDVSRHFPGFAALVPTLSAALIIIAGASGVTGAAIGILSSRPMLRLGDVAYPFFLWHWPLLVFARSALGADRLSLGEGSLVLLVALALSFVTTRYVESPWRARGERRARLTAGELLVFVSVPALLVALAAATPSLLVSLSAAGRDTYSTDAYIGALALEGRPRAKPEDLNDPAVPILPSPTVARADRPDPYADGCHQTQEESHPIACSYGQVGAPVRIALVGGSHSTHWQPVLDLLGARNGWEIVNITKSACRFSTEQVENATCNEWNDLVIGAVRDLDVDLVFTTGTLGRGVDERVPDGYVAQWHRLNDAGIPVVAVRDNPWWPYEVPECVQEAATPHTHCVLNRAQILPKTPAWVDDDRGAPDNVSFIDLTDSFCTASACPAVVGNILVYRDSHHISVAYSLSLATAVERALREVAPQLFD